jgi:hypothetical protein
MGRSEVRTVTLIAYAIAVALFAGAMVYDGFVMLKLWEWFVVPPFGVPMLTLAQAIGLGLLTMFATTPYVHRKTPTGVEALKAIAMAWLARPTAILCVGWIVARFV